MKLTVLGSGTSIIPDGKEFRYPAAHLLETGDYKILFDTGIGVMPQLAKLGLTLKDINTICVTHFHADHYTPEPLLQAYMLYGWQGTRPKVHILGPDTIESRTQTGFESRGFSYRDSLLARADITFGSYKDNEKIVLTNGVVLTPFKTKHYDMDAYALRLEAEGKIVAYSGDSTVSKGLKHAAQNADLFLCEAFVSPGTTSDDGHLSPEDAAKIATEANAQRLVLTHYSGKDNRDTLLADAKQSGYQGDVEVAQDLSTYEI